MIVGFTYTARRQVAELLGSDNSRAGDESNEGLHVDGWSEGWRVVDGGWMFRMKMLGLLVGVMW